MSKVIKGSDMLLFQPKVIDLTAIYELKKQAEAEKLEATEEITEEDLLSNDIALKQLELKEKKDRIPLRLQCRIMRLSKLFYP